MQKLILFTSVFLLLTCSLVAQQKFKPSTSIGFNAGGSLCRVGFNPPVNQNALNTGYAGLVFRHVSEPHIGIQIELNYAGRGWIENLDSLGTYKRNLKVLDFPVTAAFIAGSKKLRFVFTLGPYLTYLLHDEEKRSIVDTAYYKEYYGKELSGNWKYGLTGGLSVEWHTPLGAFGIRAAYCYNLTNIFPLNNEKYYYSGSKMQTLNAGITYSIKL
jgi:hypothetical protein